jgi:hypothetical protein
LFPEEKYDFDEVVELLRSQLDTVEFEKAWAEGQTMALDEAVKFALAIRLGDEFQG